MDSSHTCRLPQLLLDSIGPHLQGSPGQKPAQNWLVDTYHINPWLSKRPAEFNPQLNFGGPGTPSGGGSDDASFSGFGAPIFGLGAASWDYSNYAWHTERDTFDKIVFDDLKGNAAITAMPVYLASEDSTMMGRERVGLAAANAARGGGAGGRGGPGTFTWPVCTDAPRSTNPRIR